MTHPVCDAAGRVEPVPESRTYPNLMNRDPHPIAGPRRRSGWADTARGQLLALQLRLFSHGWQRAPRWTARLEETIWRAARRRSPRRLAALQLGESRLSVEWVGHDIEHGRWLGRGLAVECAAVHGSVRADARGARGLPVSPDLTVAEVPTWIAPHLGRHGWLILPKQVAHHQSFLGAAGQPNAYERDLSERLAAADLSLRFTSARRDLARFDAELYRPTVERHHGHDGHPTPWPVLRLLVARGGLVLVERAGLPVAGAVAAPSPLDPGELRISVLGVRDGDYQRVEELARLAPIGAWVGRARRERFGLCNHMGSLPFVHDGLMRRKLRWGTSLATFPERRTVLAVRINRDGPGLAALLGQRPCICLSRAGLVGVAGAAQSHRSDDGEPLRWPPGLVATHVLPVEPSDALAPALQALARGFW